MPKSVQVQTDLEVGRHKKIIIIDKKSFKKIKVKFVLRKGAI
jgi:hypothetical protein